VPCRRTGACLMITFLEPTTSRASSDDRALLVDVITRAFAADPPSRWLYPDDREYWRFFPRFVEVFGGSAIDYGTADMAGDAGAGALCFLQEDTRTRPPSVRSWRKASTGRGSRPRFRYSSGWPGTIRPVRTGICRSSGSHRAIRDGAMDQGCSNTPSRAAIATNYRRTWSRRARAACVSIVGTASR
jgi:hypothetical protein